MAANCFSGTCTSANCREHQRRRTPSIFLCFRFWQEGPGFDRNLFSPAAIASSTDYIHANPVKRGLCQSAVDFKWSSARFHLRDIVDPDLPVLRKPDPEWFHTTGVRFDSVEHWQSQWHTNTPSPDIRPASATPPFRRMSCRAIS